ncbi:MAG TPA: sigma-54 dependent transcriptional regulator [Thermoanaerobaculia bacterium]|nr:sigma-54 dependent transcriptional regulator [Thermoanaerobaculia bacterium]
MSRILIVEQEPLIRRTFGALFGEEGYVVIEANSGEEALARSDELPPIVALVDFDLPGIDGIETVGRICKRSPHTVLVLITAQGTIPSTVEAMRHGAFDVLIRPFREEEFLRVVKRAIEVHQMASEVAILRVERESAYGFNEIIGVSPVIEAVFRVMAKVAPVNATVLITGESGTGKELVARAIHRRSQRARGNFVAVNCCAIPQALVESEFFGHEKGAFTDAHFRRIGRFEEAQGGTLFLDEVGDLAMDAQAKLLRALQERQITPVGGGRLRDLDVRVIAATNKDLVQLVREEHFREDLFWRLNVFPLHLPPLRERKEDLVLLCDHFLERFNRELGLAVTGISSETRQLLVEYAWPGNIRELENTICRSMILCEGRILVPADLPARIRGEVTGDHDLPPSGFEGLSLTDAVREATEKVEKIMITSRLDSHRGDRAGTAASLGISRKTLFNKLRRYHLE